MECCHYAASFDGSTAFMTKNAKPAANPTATAFGSGVNSSMESVNHPTIIAVQHETMLFVRLFISRPIGFQRIFNRSHNAVPQPYLMDYILAIVQPDSSFLPNRLHCGHSHSPDHRTPTANPIQFHQAVFAGMNARIAKMVCQEANRALAKFGVRIQQHAHVAINLAPCPYQMST